MNIFKKMSDEQLLKQEKITKGLTYVLGGSLLLLFCLNIYLGIRDGFNFGSMAVPIALSPILLLNVMNMKKIKTEKQTRNL